MYLSKLLLNPRCRQVWREIQNPYEMHRTLSKAFPFGNEAENNRILFRTEQEEGIGVSVLVQSVLKPDWSLLTVSENYFLTGNYHPHCVKEFSTELPAGNLYHFKLRANTVRRDKATGKRVGVYDEKDLCDWLSRKSLNAGFSLIGFQVHRENQFVASIPGSEDKHNATLASTVFQGILKVENPSLFSDTIRSGLGAAKGLGFGMLSLVSYSEVE
ncbi:CRISPR-associated endoribonuclease Cse3 [uncultured bacterium]|nr:CRISPR-associated endoribonuclease Cse3 [uncultured bacterium]